MKKLSEKLLHCVTHVLPLEFENSLSPYELISKILRKTNETVGAVNDIDERVEAVESVVPDIEEIESTVNDHSTDLISVHAELNESDGRITAVENTVNNHEADLTTIHAELNDEDSRITTLENSTLNLPFKVYPLPGEDTNITINFSDGDFTALTNLLRRRLVTENVTITIHFTDDDTFTPSKLLGLYNIQTAANKALTIKTSYTGEYQNVYVAHCILDIKQCMGNIIVEQGKFAASDNTIQNQTINVEKSRGIIIRNNTLSVDSGANQAKYAIRCSESNVRIENNTINMVGENMVGVYMENGSYVCIVNNSGAIPNSRAYEAFRSVVVGSNTTHPTSGVDDLFQASSIVASTFTS